MVAVKEHKLSQGLPFFSDVLSIIGLCSLCCFHHAFTFIILWVPIFKWQYRIFCKDSV